MKILFQGGWKKNRDPPENKVKVADYCHSLAKHLVNSDHHLVLTSNRYYDQLIAGDIASLAREAGRNPKDFLTYLLPNRYNDIPSEGKVKKFEKTRWGFEERFFFIKETDALIAIGGGKGTSDSIQKAYLSANPFLQYFLFQELQQKRGKPYHLIIIILKKMMLILY
jgi:hypothetical protein